MMRFQDGIVPPPPVCQVELLPAVIISMPRWPSLWARFWFRLLFGWRFVPVEKA